jgi:hypothetical protein
VSRAFCLRLAACLTLAATTLRGQGAVVDRASDPGDVTIRAARRDTITAGATVTAAFTIASRRSDSTVVTPRIELPKDWTLLMGGADVVVASRSTEMLMLSVVVPARALAGVYPIRVGLTGPAEPKGVSDSILVSVPARRMLDIGLIDRPGFTVSGKTYDAEFQLRNRGNQVTRVRLVARSSIGAVVLPDSVLTLEPEASRVVRVHVRTPPGLEAATDDVLELSAAIVGDTIVPGQASARVTVIPEPSRKIEEFLRIPTRINLRAANTDGVSPFEILGGGRVRDGSAARADFLFRGPTGRFSSFGERDEYRLDLTAPTWRARFGDQFFMLTPLTGGAQPGFGAGFDGTAAAHGLSFGGYGQEFRRTPERGSETGAFVAAYPGDNGRVALNLVNRLGGRLPARVGSAAASYQLGTYRADGEVARSDATSSRGNARSARLSGASSAYAFDLGHHFSDTAFAGAVRGAAHDYLTASLHQFELVSFGINAGSHRTDLSQSTGVPYTERLDVRALTATIADRLTLELHGVERATTVQGVRAAARQRSIRSRTDQPTAVALISLEAEIGRAREASLPTRAFSQLSVAARRTLEHGTLGVWAEQYSGGGITQGAEGTRTVGGDIAVRVGRLTEIAVNGYATRQRLAGASWHSQLDGTVSRTLPNGNSVSLRARLIAGGTSPRSEQSVAYLEYGMPFRLPVSRLRTPGRVYGRVVDATTGNGVPGALVRLGPQVAITDKQGEVAFGGVPGGEHRLSMSQETSFADAVFVGDPTLMVDSTRTQPTMFRLAIARSARLDIDVRKFAVTRTGISGAADSLSDTGPLANAMLMLVGSRDTLYRTTTEDGKVSFTDIPPGAWVVSIRGDAPAFHRFDPDRVELKLAPAETQTLTFRLVPRRREVQLIGDGQELRPTTAAPRATAPAGSVKTVKPNRQEKDDR